MKLGDAVKRVREAAKMTQDVLADRTGASKPSISRIENGAQAPSMDMLERIAAALNVKVYQLLAEAEGVRLPVAHATEQELQIIGHFRTMDPQTRYLVQGVVDSLGRRATVPEEEAIGYSEHPSISAAIEAVRSWVEVEQGKLRPAAIIREMVKTLSDARPPIETRARIAGFGLLMADFEVNAGNIAWLLRDQHLGWPERPNFNFQIVR